MRVYGNIRQYARNNKPDKTEKDNTNFNWKSIAITSGEAKANTRQWGLKDATQAAVKLARSSTTSWWQKSSIYQGIPIGRSSHGTLE